MSKHTVTASQSPEGEHIFPAAQLTPLAIRWKQLTAAGRHKEAMFVLEQIITGSTAMFERLAQFENFHYTVDLPILVGAAQEKVVKWLLRWEPKKGRLFTWFSRCAKNAFRSELDKVNRDRKHLHVTGDNLEKFYGTEDHDVDKKDLAKSFQAKLKQMTCRWGDPQEIAAIRYLIDCVLDDDGYDKQGAILGASYAWGISLESSKFFYSWVVTALRHEYYDSVYVPFTEQDLFRASQSYEHVVDLLEYMDWDSAKRLMVRWQGMRIKFPSLTAMAKVHENYLLYRDIEKSDLDPDSITEVARKHKRTQRAAQEIYNDMVETLRPNRTGEYDIYDDDGNREG